MWAGLIEALARANDSATPSPTAPAPFPKPKARPKAKAPGAFPAECGLKGGVVEGGTPVPGGFAATDSRATLHHYGPRYDVNTTACADFYNGKNGNKKWAKDDLLRYPWTALCVPNMCGRCVRVTNKRTKQSVVARVVDYGGCTGVKNGMDLDPCGFSAIDADRRGHADGHMMVDITEVVC